MSIVVQKCGGSSVADVGRIRQVADRVMRTMQIFARATSSALPGADPSADGTVVRRHPPRQSGTVVGVASKRDVLVLSTERDGSSRAERSPERLALLRQPLAISH